MARMTERMSDHRFSAPDDVRKGRKKEAPLLFAVLEYGEFPELLRVADVLHARLERQVLFLFVKRSYRRLAEDSQAVIERGFVWIDDLGELHDAPAPVQEKEARPVAAPAPRSLQEPQPPLEATSRSLWALLSASVCLPFYGLAYLGRDTAVSVRVLARQGANFYRDLRRFRARYRAMEKLLVRYRPSLLIVGQDPPATELPMLLIAAGRLGIPRLMTPFAMFSLRETAEYGWTQESHQADASAFNALVATFFPHWLLSWKGRRFLRLPGPRAFALECAGLVHGLPWSPLSEPVEAITAESRVAAAALAGMGIDHARIAIVGSPVHDRLAIHLENRDALRQELCVRHGLDPGRPILVCGWPANIFPWLAGRAIRYADYPALALAWAKALAEMRDSHGINVLVSVHPKTLAEEYQVAEDHGLVCCLGGTDELIAACDLFTTLNGSSVTAWAIACGLPVLLFDCFETNYTDFNDVPGCIQVQTEEEFVARLDTLCAVQGERARLAVAQQQVADDWGRLDGGVSKRLGALAESLVG